MNQRLWVYQDLQFLELNRKFVTSVDLNYALSDSL